MLKIILAALYLFSADATNPGSSPRALPSQGRDLESGEVVVGLHALTPPERARCGWYEIVEGDRPTPGADGRVVVSGYAFSRADGTAVEQYEVRPHVSPPRRYSKFAIVVALKERGVWPQVLQWIQAADIYDEYLAAQEFSEDNPYFAAGLEALRPVIGLTPEEIAEILESARVK